MVQPTVEAVRFAEAIEKKFNAEQVEKWPSASPKIIIVVAGGKYDKIVSDSSVHAFVVRATGDLVKAAGWNAPAKSKTHPTGLAVRYNLSTPAAFKEALEAADPYTSYLYA